MAHARSESFRQIFKSSAVLGSARIFGVLTGMVRVKLLAMLIGKAGVGLSGTCESIALMAASITAVGIHGSAVRQIAQAIGAGNREEAGRAIKTLRHLLTALGLLGMVVMMALAWPISFLTFHNGNYAWDMALLALALPLIMGTYCRMAIVQGLGRMGDLARQNVWGGVLGSALAVIFIVALREKGIVPALLAGYGGSFAAAWWFGRSMDVPPSNITLKESIRESGIYFKLGIALMNASLLATLVLYIARATIAQTMGLAAVGVYVCAFSLSGKFVSLIIDPMWADFFPRASALAHDEAALNRVVNEQTEVTLLLAAPGLLATLLFAPWFVKLFYSSDFGDAPLLMRWFILGCFFGIVEMPVRMVQMAMGRSFLCFITETIGGAIHIGFIIVLLHLFSLKGCAIAYPIHTIIQLLVSFFVARRLSRFSYTPHCARMLTLFALAAVACCVASFLLNEWQLLGVGVVAMCGVIVYSVRGLLARLGSDHRLARYLGKLPFVSWILVPQ